MVTKSIVAKPIIREHDGVLVVRDDLIAGGTKSRFILPYFARLNSMGPPLKDEIVYASPAYGGAQLSLAYCAAAVGKKATIFVAARKQMHPRTKEASLVGANIVEIRPGYLTKIQKEARDYARSTSFGRAAMLMKFGGGTDAINILAEAAAEVAKEVGYLDEVWCAAGSGVLLRAVQECLPAARHIGVQVGHQLSWEERGKAIIHKAELPFEKEYKCVVPFPSCRNYDAKAWAVCKRLGKGKRLFWNVLGPSPTPFVMGNWG